MIICWPCGELQSVSPHFLGVKLPIAVVLESKDKSWLLADSPHTVSSLNGSKGSEPIPRCCRRVVESRGISRSLCEGEEVLVLPHKCAVECFRWSCKSAERFSYSLIDCETGTERLPVFIILIQIALILK